MARFGGGVASLKGLLEINTQNLFVYRVHFLLTARLPHLMANSPTTVHLMVGDQFSEFSEHASELNNMRLGKSEINNNKKRTIKNTKESRVGKEESRRKGTGTGAPPRPAV